MLGQGFSSSDTLAVHVEGKLFSSKEYSKLTEFLSELDRSTDAVMIDDDSQLALSRRGTTVGGDKLSWLALRQISKTLSSGLAMSLSDLLGYRRLMDDMDNPLKHKADPDDDFTVGEAAALYNLALKKRFGRLFGFQAIRNSQTKVIEAVVSNRYRRISNSEFLSGVEGIIESLDLKFDFRSASVYDRKISLTYTIKDFEGSDLTPGLLISNSEIGDAAIKATLILIDSTDSIMSAPYGKLGRVSHSGRDLLGKLSQLVTGVSSRLANQTFTVDGLNKKIAENRGKFLGFKGEGEDDARFKALVEFLTERAGMTYAMSRKCLAKTLAGPDLDNNSFSMLERSKVWPNKSVMCLVEVIMKECRDQFLTNFFSKERFERIAWALFFNKLPIPDCSGD